MNIIKKTIQLADGRTIEIETGKLAKQADGSAVVKMGGTMLLATVTCAKEAEEEQTTEDAPETEQTKELKPIADTAVTRAVIEEVRKALGEEPQDTITEEDLLQSLAETEAETAEPEQPAVEEEAPVAPVVEQPIEEAPVATAAEQSVEVPVAEPEAKAEPEVHATEDTTPVASTVEQPEEASVATAIEQPVEEQPTSEPVQETAPQSATATAQPDDSEENPVEKQITGQLSFNDIMAGWEETKKAVESGYWNMLRFNPDLAAKGENPLIIDSKEATGSYRDFLMGEVRYNSLTQRFPDKAEELFTEAERLAKERFEHLQAIQKSYDA